VPPAKERATSKDWKVQSKQANSKATVDSGLASLFDNKNEGDYLTPAASKHMRISRTNLTGIPNLEAPGADGKPREMKRSSVIMPYELFQMFANAEGTDALTPTVFHELLSAAGIKVSKKEVKALVRQVDTNGDGLIQEEEFLTYFERATTRVELRETVEGVVKDQREYCKKLFNEFKTVEGELEGVEEPQFLEMCKILRVDKCVTKDDLRALFKVLDVRGQYVLAGAKQGAPVPPGNGLLNFEEVNDFCDMQDKVETLKEFVMDIGFDKLADSETTQRKVYDLFDFDPKKTRKGMMLSQHFLYAVEFMPIPQEVGGPALKKLCRQIAGRKAHIPFNDFLSIWEHVKNAQDTKQYVDEFEKGDPVKTIITLIVVGITAGIAATALLVSYLQNSPVLGAIGMAALAMAIYQVLYAQGCLVSSDGALNPGPRKWPPIVGLALLLIGISDLVTASITGAAMALGSGAFAAVVLGAMLLVAAAIRRMKFFAHWFDVNKAFNMENDIEKAALEEAKIEELKRKRDLEHKKKVMAIPEPWGMKGQNNSQSVRPELPKRRGLYRRNSKVEADASAEAKAKKKAAKKAEEEAAVLAAALGEQGGEAADDDPEGLHETSLPGAIQVTAPSPADTDGRQHRVSMKKYGRVSPGGPRLDMSLYATATKDFDGEEKPSWSTRAVVGGRRLREDIVAANDKKRAGLLYEKPWIHEDD
jgi:Ca2+-binding EF-hand superfamily protein